jgi:phenylpyruvate tautomerase PptA (4-oxalocrotonate tautomerase family)
MLRLTRAAAFAVAAVALTVTVAVAEDKKSEEAKGEVLKTVIDATYDFDKEKKKLTVNAVGQVPTGGWKDAKLTRRATKDAPKDGIYEYDLTAVRPTGIVTQVISKVKASDVWENPPADIKGVKVYGVGDGAKTVKFDK